MFYGKGILVSGRSFPLVMKKIIECVCPLS